MKKKVKLDLIHQKTYKYWFIYIRPKYSENLSFVYNTSNDDSILPLFAYTSKRSLLNGFLEFHEKDALIVKKMQLSREEVNDLARYYQNDIIRKYNLSTKDSKHKKVEISLYMTEREFLSSETICYNQIETIFKYAWDPISRFKLDIITSLNILGYDTIFRTLEKGECQVVKNLIPDIYGSFKIVYEPILRKDII